jgi:hypothetical protein
LTSAGTLDASILPGGRTLVKPLLHHSLEPGFRRPETLRSSWSTWLWIALATGLIVSLVTALLLGLNSPTT